MITFNTDNKNRLAITITALVLLALLWLIFGHTSEHVWSSPLFFVLFVATIVALTNNWINHLRNQLFDGDLALTIVVFILFFVFANIEMGVWQASVETLFNILNIIRWIIVVGYIGLAIFTIIRTVIEQQS